MIYDRLIFLFSLPSLPRDDDVTALSQCPFSVAAVSAPLVAFDVSRNADVFIDQNRTQYLFQESCDVDACEAAGAVCDQVRNSSKI